MRRLVPAAFVVACSFVVALAPASATLVPIDDTGDVRIAGPDRYATSAAISQSIASAPHRAVVVASGENFPDALAVGPLVLELPVEDGWAAEEFPILLVGRDRIPNAVAAEIQRLAPDHIVVVGGPAAVSDAVLTQLAGIVGTAEVGRVSGEDRYETAAMLTAGVDPVDEVFVVSGEGFPDALTAGPAAARQGTVLVLTRTASLPQPSADTLTRLAPSKVTVVGGPAAVSDAVVAQIQQALPGATVSRVSGPNRYATAAAVADAVWPNGAESVFLAPGAKFPDALSGTPAATLNDAPILLTRETCHPSETIASLADLDPALRVHLGGELATYMGTTVCGTPEPTPEPEPETAPGPDPRVVDDVDCTDFATHAEAQAWFVYWYPIVGDLFNLDRDGDGSACESLP